MAMEDVYLLYRLLRAEDNLGTVFKKFDRMRRPRIQEISEISQKGGDIRRETGPWAQWFKETMMWLWLKFMPEAWMTSPFEYDITTVEIPASI